MKFWRSLVGLAGLSLLAAAPAPEPQSFLIAGARVADGTGAPLVTEDVRVQGDRIVAVGKLAPRDGERVIRGEKLVLAPGFIDVHNHSTEGLATDPLAETQISQGITTLVLGPDGDSPWPIAAYLDRARQGAGHGQRHDDGRPRDGPQPRDGQGLQAQVHARGNREDGRARRPRG